jgi:small-conductance mechanosensitive channel
MDGALLGMLIAHGLFILSGITYSIYWVLQDAAPGPTALALFFLSILFGFGAAIGTFSCVLAAVPLRDDRRLRLWHIVVANLALVVAMTFVTTRIIGRVFTSELVFVVIWSTAEYCAIRVALSKEWLPGRAALVAAGLVSAGLAVGLACYSVYFLFDGRERFYCGLVPYGAVTVAMVAVGALLLRSPRRPVV